jgi:hypothetical protein
MLLVSKTQPADSGFVNLCPTKPLEIQSLETSEIEEEKL